MKILFAFNISCLSLPDVAKFGKLNIVVSLWNSCRYAFLLTFHILTGRLLELILRPAVYPHETLQEYFQF